MWLSRSISSGPMTRLQPVELVEAGERDPQRLGEFPLDVDVGTPRTSRPSATAAPSARINEWRVVPEPSPSNMPGFT